MTFEDIGLVRQESFLKDYSLVGHLVNALVNTQNVNYDDRYRGDFENGYGASVIRNCYTFGSENGLWELAVFKNDEICYDSGITSDVLRSLTDQDVIETVLRIKALPKAE